MKSKVKTVGVIAAAVLVVCVAVKLLQQPEEVMATALPVVETVNPENSSIFLKTDLTGTVEPEEMVEIYPESSGTVTEVMIKAGDRVSQGQHICTIDTKQVDSARNAMDSAELALKEAETELSRQQPLYSSGFVSPQEYENYVNTVERARLSYEKAKLEYEKQVSYSHVTAPISGIVESCDMEVLDKVSASTQICVITGEGNKVISTGLTEQLKDSVQPGDKIWVDKSGTDYIGYIYEISSMADQASGLYKMKARMSQENPLSTGAVAKISFVTEKAENVMTVPVDSVYYDNGDPYVYTYDNGVVHKVFVETGIYDSEAMEIRSGLQYEDQVIVTWSPELYEGALVERKTAEGEAAE